MNLKNKNKNGKKTERKTEKKRTQTIWKKDRKTPSRKLPQAFQNRRGKRMEASQNQNEDVARKTLNRVAQVN